MSDEGFAGRWSRRKAAARGTADAEPTAVAAPTEEAGSPQDAPDLPDPDTLERDADFAAFMAAGVPQALRRRALRRLWQVDPVFSRLDGLVEYNDDFTAAGKPVGSLRETAHAARRMARRAVEALDDDDGKADATASPETVDGDDRDA